jgi:hypothetical protein
MKTKVSFFLIGIIITTCAFYIYSNTRTLESEKHTSTFTTNEETGASARIMEADVIYFDTDGDGEDENILLYSCQGCNAPPREMAIIDDGELVFFYEGGELKFIPQKAGSFVISEARVPRDGRSLSTWYSYATSSSKYVVENN